MRHNSVLVRSEKMLKIINEMKEKGILVIKELDNEGFKKIIKNTRNKRENMEKVPKFQVQQSAEKFNRYRPQEWNINQFGYEPEIHPEYYRRMEYSESV